LFKINYENDIIIYYYNIYMASPKEYPPKIYTLNEQLIKNKVQKNKLYKSLSLNDIKQYYDENMDNSRRSLRNYTNDIPVGIPIINRTNIHISLDNSTNSSLSNSSINDCLMPVNLCNQPNLLNDNLSISNLVAYNSLNLQRLYQSMEK